MKRLLRALPLTAALALFPLLSGTAFAASASLYMAPSASSVVNGNTVTVYIHESSGSEPVNGVQANFSYPASLLQFVSINSTSAFSIVAQNSGGGGSVAIARGAMPAVSGDQVVASVSFKAIASSGTATLAFTSGSAVTSANSNTNIMTSSPGTSITLKAPAPAPAPSPKPSPSPSPTPTPTPTKDTTAPQISSISVKNITASSATITWTTSEVATSEVDYGLNTNYGLTATDSKLVTSHSITLNSALIISGTAYHFRVKSADGAGNVATSSDSSFTTSGATLIVTVLDQKTGKPVAGAIVSYNGQTATTNQSGQATLTNLPSTKVAVQITVSGKSVNETVEVGASSADKPQNVSFKVAVPASPMNWTVIGVVAVVVIAAVAIFAYLRGRGNRNLSNHFPTPTPPSSTDAPYGPSAPNSPMSMTPPTPPAPSVISPTEPVHRDTLVQ